MKMVISKLGVRWREHTNNLYLKGMDTSHKFPMEACDEVVECCEGIDHDEVDRDEFIRKRCRVL